MKRERGTFFLLPALTYIHFSLLTKTIAQIKLQPILSPEIPQDPGAPSPNLSPIQKIRKFFRSIPTVPPNFPPPHHHRIGPFLNAFLYANRVPIATRPTFFSFTLRPAAQNVPPPPSKLSRGPRPALFFDLKLRPTPVGPPRCFCFLCRHFFFCSWCCPGT